MTDFANPTTAELRARLQQQDPFVRALTGPVIEVVTTRLSLMQGVNDAQAEAVSSLVSLRRRAVVGSSTFSQGSLVSCGPSAGASTSAIESGGRVVLVRQVTTHEEAGGDGESRGPDRVAGREEEGSRIVAAAPVLASEVGAGGMGWVPAVHHEDPAMGELSVADPEDPGSTLSYVPGGATAGGTALALGLALAGAAWS